MRTDQTIVNHRGFLQQSETAYISQKDVLVQVRTCVSLGEDFDVIDTEDCQMHKTLWDIQKQISAMQVTLRRPSFFQALYSTALQYFAFYIRPPVLEESLTLRPESYGHLDVVRVLGFTSKLLQEQSLEMPVIAHDIIIAKDLRNWIRLQVEVQLATQQRYFGQAVSHISSQPFHRARERQLPLVLHQMLNDVLSEHSDEMEDDVRIRVDLLEDGVSISPPIVLPSQASPMLDELCNLTEMIRHRDIPIIPEDELVTVNGPASYFFAQLDGRWLRYGPLIGGDRPIHDLKRTLEKVFALRDAPHVTQLAGFVVGAKDHLYKGLLMNMARHGPLFSFLVRQQLEGKPVSWPIRQKWAKQLVRAVAAFHRRGQTCGTLNTLNHGLALDENFDIEIAPSIVFSHPGHWGFFPGALPPECRSVAFKYGTGEIQATFDIFQLGLLLWNLYHDESQQSEQQFCLLAGCSNAVMNSCEVHGDPISLPSVGDDIPAYLEEVINSCRHEEARKRPTAEKLLQLFPSDKEINDQIIASGGFKFKVGSVGPITRLEEARSLYFMGPTCDVCCRKCHGVTYVCLTCSNGDYDLCQSCFDRGIHCRDAAHVLIEQDIANVSQRAGGRRVVQYSSVGHDGRRSRSVC